MSSPLDLGPVRLPEGALATFRLRRGRITPRQQAALEHHWDRWGLVADGRPLDPVALFARRAPLLVEVGSGMGEATVATAVADPELDVLAVEVHTPGLGALLAAVEERGLTNVRAVDGDARVLLHALPPACAAAVRVLFPDPWPKARHAKRRLVDRAFVDLAVSRLAPGGVLHVATDWADYAAQVRAVTAHLEPVPPPARPLTRFEQQGRDAGRDVVDVAVRSAAGAAAGATAGPGPG